MLMMGPLQHWVKVEGWVVPILLSFGLEAQGASSKGMVPQM